MCLSRFSMVDEMISLYKEMLTDNGNSVFPNLITLNTMLNSYCKLGNMAVARLFFVRILRCEPGPDLFTYTSLVLGYCRNDDVEERGCEDDLDDESPVFPGPAVRAHDEHGGGPEEDGLQGAEEEEAGGGEGSHSFGEEGAAAEGVESAASGFGDGDDGGEGPGYAEVDDGEEDEDGGDGNEDRGGGGGGKEEDGGE